MAVPDYQSLMLPLLQLAGDAQEHLLGDAIETLAQQFGLTEADRKELLASGAQFRFDNRVGWARTYLKKAGLLQSPTRGRFCITERGQSILMRKPPRIDAKFLRQFPEFLDFQHASRHPSKPGDQDEIATPEEQLEASYQTLRQALAQELLDKAKRCKPAFFERLVVDLLVAMGYGGSRKDASQAIGRTGDEGVDGIIKEDSLGLDVVCVQAKRWNGTVGRPIVQAFAGSLMGQKAKKGVFITTSQFSQDARDFTGKIDTKIVLIDGPQLADLMIDHGIGVTEAARYLVMKSDQDYFAED